MKLDINTASDYPTPDLVQLLNLTFEDYLVPIHFDHSQFLTMLRKDNIDLDSSRVLLADSEPSGIALIARRGTFRASRLAGMGITREMRGKSAGSWLMGQLIKEARARNDREMVLEVIEQNKPAVRLYKKYGFQAIRRLIGWIRQDVKQDAKGDLQEMDLCEMGRLILRHGLPDLPWQLSGETIALLNPPARAFKNGQAYIAISNPDAEHVVIWSLLVEPDARGKGLAVELLENVMANHNGKTWHVPAIWPEELGIIFERSGFQREELSQWQMRLDL
ncbi:MAG TPA: GNAT family N-acetyltransferase [Anaerolineales bacterium]|nr:GNAT family N-acetyltransferase [Anaerolineales bacterium]